MRRRAALLLLCGGLAPLPAGASATGPAVTLRDLPGTDGEWQEAAAVVAAPAAQVRAWLLDYDRWPVLFKDIESSARLGTTDDGAAIVRFTSRLAERTITIREWRTNFGLVYVGRGGDVSTQGRIYIITRGDGTTRLIMQCTSRVHGLLGLFASRGMRRERSNDIMKSHFESLFDLAAARAARAAR